MAEEGLKFMNFYSSAPLCSPSRLVGMGAPNSLKGNNKSIENKFIVLV